MEEINDLCSDMLDKFEFVLYPFEHGLANWANELSEALEQGQE